MVGEYAGTMRNMLGISFNLRFLQNAGWSDLIDRRLKAQVHQELLEHFPEMCEVE